MARVFVGIGSNVNREFHIRTGIEALRALFGELNLSTVYDSPAAGFKGDNFLNLVVEFHTGMPVRQLWTALREIEIRHGRTADIEKFSPRTLDMDILLYDDLVIDEGDLRLPREDLQRYAFVLRPLAELAGDVRHPESGRTIADMWREFEHESPEMQPVPLPGADD